MEILAMLLHTYQLILLETISSNTHVNKNPGVCFIENIDVLFRYGLGCRINKLATQKEHVPQFFDSKKIIFR